MKIKHVSSTHVFEADDEAAKALITRGDYEKASKADQESAQAANAPAGATPTVGRRTSRIRRNA